MADFTAKDVQRLRQATGAGMMDAKKALEACDGDFEAAAKWLREKGLAKAANLTDRDNAQGTVAIGGSGLVGAIVELKCETDFSAKADDYVAVVQKLADAVASDGEGAIEANAAEIEDLKVQKKENIEVGRVVRIEAAGGNVLDRYLHQQDGRGVNAVLVEVAGGDEALAHDVAIQIAFTKPPYLTRDEVPADEVDAERATLADITRAEGKPEQAVPKIVEGRLTAWYQERVLLDQKFVRDEKQTVQAMLGDATVVRFAQAFIGE